MEFFTDRELFIQYIYLASATMFIFGIKLLGSPATARKGNLLAAAAMFIAVLVTLVNLEVLNYGMIAAGIAIGAVIGAVLARTIKMTAMPQMVAIFNGVGGGASALIAISEFARITNGDLSVAKHEEIAIMLGTLIGLVTLTGSLIAFGKLQEIMTTRPITFPFQNIASGAHTSVQTPRPASAQPSDVPAMAMLAAKFAMAGRRKSRSRTISASGIAMKGIVR